MTQDELMELARDAGFETGQRDMQSGGNAMPYARPIGSTCLVELAKFAALVEARKKEQCANVCDEIAKGEIDYDYVLGAVACSNGIRAMKD